MIQSNVRMAPVLVLGLVASVSQIDARTWTVGPDSSENFTSIQAAVDAAKDGDEVLVKNGVYYEHISLSGKRIRVQGSGRGTILDGSALEGSCVSFVSGEASDSVLENLVIMHGTGEEVGESRLGGGILIVNSEPTLRRLLVMDNLLSPALSNMGGGVTILALGAMMRPLFIQCQFEINSAGQGGGVAVIGNAAACFKDCTFVGNRATAGDGGGLLVRSGTGKTLIANCRFQENYSNDNGGALVWSTDPLGHGAIDIQASCFWRNIAIGVSSGTGNGGTIMLSGGLSTIVNSNIAFNIGAAGAQAGIVLRGSNSTTITQSIIAFNGTHGAVYRSPGTALAGNCNLVWGNSGVCEHCESGVEHLSGTVRANPLFCDIVFSPADLRPDSPALREPCGPIGVASKPACEANSVQSTWSQIKSRFR